MNTHSQHLCIDTETLGFTDNAVITSLAITPFYFNEANVTYEELLARTFYVKIDGKAQIKNMGRKPEKSTLEWWKLQPKHVQEMSVIPHVDDIAPLLAAEMINKFVRSLPYEFKASYIFERGMGFDTNKVDTFFRQLDKKAAINFWRAREIRTFNDLVGDVDDGKWELPEGRPTSFIEHHAQHDAAHDALKLIRMFNSD